MYGLYQWRAALHPTLAGLSWRFAGVIGKGIVAWIDRYVGAPPSPLNLCDADRGRASQHRHTIHYPSADAHCQVSRPWPAGTVWARMARYRTPTAAIVFRLGLSATRSGSTTSST